MSFKAVIESETKMSNWNPIISVSMRIGICLCYKSVISNVHLCTTEYLIFERYRVIHFNSFSIMEVISLLDIIYTYWFREIVTTSAICIESGCRL